MESDNYTIAKKAVMMIDHFHEQVTAKAKITNFVENSVPEMFMDISDYQLFLDTRRSMMAQYIKEFYKSLE